jgi:hypothetical protein
MNTWTAERTFAQSFCGFCGKILDAFALVAEDHYF